MLIKQAEYTASYVSVDKCPKPEVPEFAFIGRSNVGKSSLINYLCGRKKLSKVSGTPGKTQTINYFSINGNINFVDLPGYSFARVSKEMRDKWDNMIRNYILHREQLMYVCQLVDARIPPQKVDLEFIGCRVLESLYVQQRLIPTRLHVEHVAQKILFHKPVCTLSLLGIQKRLLRLAPLCL